MGMPQELVHLGGKEPGESILHLTMDGKEAQIKPEWVAGGIPESGTFTLFFVRTQGCLDKVFDKGAFDHSKRAPPESSKSTFMESYLAEFCKEGFSSPGGEEWIKPFMYRRVRRKLGDKFSTAEHAFYAIDDDGSGSLTRNEVGNGLQQVLIFHHMLFLWASVSSAALLSTNWSCFCCMCSLSWRACCCRWGYI